MCRTPREAGCVMRWTALPRYGKKTRTGLFFVPSRRRCFPRSYGFPAGNVPVSDNIPAGFAVTFLGAFFRLPGLVLLPLRREAGAVASNAFGCADYGSGRRKTPGQAELPGRCGIIPHGCRIIPQIFVYI